MTLGKGYDTNVFLAGRNPISRMTMLSAWDLSTVRVLRRSSPPVEFTPLTDRLRSRLEAAYPGVKFSFRSSGGITTVEWVDGPSSSDLALNVENVLLAGDDVFPARSTSHLHAAKALLQCYKDGTLLGAVYAGRGQTQACPCCHGAPCGCVRPKRPGDGCRPRRGDHLRDEPDDVTCPS